MAPPIIPPAEAPSSGRRAVREYDPDTACEPPLDLSGANANTASLVATLKRPVVGAGTQFGNTPPVSVRASMLVSWRAVALIWRRLK
jgi:hypothetical protein